MLKNIFLKNPFLIFVLVFMAIGVFYVYGIKSIIKDRPSFLSFDEIGSPLPVVDFSPPIYGKNTFGQSFTSIADNLFRIGLFMKNIGKADAKEIIFHIKESVSSPVDIISLKVKAPEIKKKYYSFRLPPIGDNGIGFFYFFEFPPIRDSKGKNLYFYLESPDSGIDNAIRLGVFNNRYLLGNVQGQAYRNHESVSGYLAFQAYCLWLGRPGDVLREIYRRLGRDPAFIVFYSLLCVLILSGLVITEIRLRRFGARQ